MQQSSVLDFLFLVGSLVGLMMMLKDFIFWLKALPNRLRGMECCFMCSIWVDLAHWLKGCKNLPQARIHRGLEYINLPVKTSMMVDKLEPAEWYAAYDD